jgi:glycosyltransferase involved in cell wall biosynthesis
MRSRSVVFLNRFYWPDHAATAQLLHDLTTYLAARDWDVSVIAAAAGYSGAGRSRDVALARREVHAGIRIDRTPALKADRMSAGGSMREYASYTAGAVRRLLTRRASIAVAMSDPPLLGAAVLPVARLCGMRMVHWVQDIHPDVASRVGALPADGVTIRTLHALARATCRNADLTVTIGPVMASHLAREGARANRLAVIPNWVDTQAVRPLNNDAIPLRQELNVGDRFVVLYSGNAARAHPMNAILQAMTLLHDRTDIVFLFIGSGIGHDELRRAAAENKLENCIFQPSLPRHRIAESHSLASLCLVTESPDVAGLLYPSKSIGIIASERPLVFLGSRDSEVAHLVEQFDCGVVLDTTDGEGLAKTIVDLKSDPARARAMGLNGRAAAVAHFDVERCCSAWEESLASLL